jgi:hypothetical protein
VRALVASALLAACHAPVPSIADTQFPAIPGGPFEASGVASVPGTRSVLFVDDGRPREVFLLDLDSAGAAASPARRIPVAANVTDLEGLTFDGTHFHMVGSQSKARGFGLVRFRFDTATRQATDVAVVRGLKAWLAEHVPELRGTARRVGDHVLNIEAIAWDPPRQRLLLGLRAPVVGGHALVIPIRLLDAKGPYATANLRADSTLRLDLGGAGIRALEYDGASGSFVVITGASLDDESRDFRVLEWDGRSPVPSGERGTFPRQLKPEGFTRAQLAGRSASVFVFDVGRFRVTP